MLLLFIRVLILLLLWLNNSYCYINVKSLILNKSISSKSISKCIIHGVQGSGQEVFDVDINEWNALIDAEKEQKETFQLAIQNKLKEWKELKDAGILQQLAEDPDSYDEDNEINKLPFKLPSNNDNNDNNNNDDTKSITYFQEKYKTMNSKKSKTKSLALYQLLNEMKDKEVYDTMLIQSILLALVKNDNSNYGMSGFNLYKKYLKENLIENTPRFLIKLTLTSFMSNALKNGDDMMTSLIHDNYYTNDDFLPSLVCRAIGDCHPYELKTNINTNTNDTKKTIGKLLIKKRDVNNNNNSNSNSNSNTNINTIDHEILKEKQSQRAIMIDKLRNNIKKYPIDEINMVVRMLGRYQYIDDIFSIIDTMNDQKYYPNDETYEFLTNSLVYTVDETAKASAMTELPSSKNAPEILFAGRSNVGKSSLVNFLVNRKALASTSATPGHTKQFHFFHINKDYQHQASSTKTYQNIPSFYFVDVPGLGYAEAEEGQKDSWRSFFERYMAVREPFALLFHLIDARHKITNVDEQMISIVLRAQSIRRNNDCKPFQYALVLTKTDKASDKQLKETINQAKVLSEKLKLELDIKTEIPIVLTSSFSKVGKVDIWKLLYKSLKSD